MEDLNKAYIMHMQNVNLNVENEIQIKSGITINVDVSEKKIIFGILLHVDVKIKNIRQVLLMI